jgi:hypothetical protein
VDVISQQAFVLDPPSGLTEGNAVHYTGSTRPEEVRAKQAEPLMIGQFSFTPNPADVNQAIDQLDQQFNVPNFFPRPGLYVVICRVELPHPSAGPPRLRCDPDGAAYRQGLGFPTFPSGRLLSGAAYSDTLDDYAGSFRHRTTQTTRSTAQFFIPALGPGKRLVRAQLRSFMSLSGDPFRVQLSGRPPLPESQFRCMPQAFLEAPFCFGQGIWDFTPEATALATGGGGELPVTFDPTPPHTDDMPNPNLHRRYAGYALNLEVNYPWGHDFFGSNSLVLDFEEECPKNLQLSVEPQRVRPAIPGETIRSVQVRASVQTCPAGASTPASIEVSFGVQPPQAGTEEAGGHDPFHQDPRPTGTFEKPFFLEGLTAASCLAPIGTEGQGSCTVTYFPHEISGTELITARADGFPDTQQRVTVQVEGLQPLEANPELYVLVGAPNNHAGTNDPCRPVAPRSRHFINHWGTPNLNAAVVRIADTMLRETGILLRVNDMSLLHGGLFDIDNDWHTPHMSHRIGKAVDIGFNGIRNGVCTRYDLKLLRTVIREVTKKAPGVEGDHYHANLQ